MKTKRLLGAFLSLAMAVPLCLTGCQKEADDIDKQSSIRQNVTLNMYILTEEHTDPEQAKAVQMAINEILLPSYKTTMKINYLTADEYWGAIEQMEQDTIEYNEKLEAEAEAAKEAAKEANLNKNKTDKTEEAEGVPSEDEVEDEFNNLIDDIFESDDIVLENPQIDIFVVDSVEKYHELIAEDRLTALDSYITLENKTLNSYVYPTFFTGAKLNTVSTYGIPVNKPIGQYEYLVFNKELLDKYGFDAESMKTFDSLESYLAVIAANEPNVVPLAHAAEPQFFEYYKNEGGAVGIGSDLMLRSAFSEGYAEQVHDHYATVRRYRTAGYLAANYTEGTPFAVDIRKGYGYSPEQWSADEGTEYECVVYKRPLATNDNTLNSIFVVSSLSKNPSRATEVISLFNTNAELANLLQYGIEGTHYYLNNDTGKIRVNPTGGYVMNNDYTGNHYIKYDLDTEENHLEAFKQQNLDSLISLYYGFVPELTLQDELVLAKADEIAQEYYDGLLKGDYDVDSVFAQITARLNAIDVSAEIAAMLADDPTLEETRYIYSYDEVKGDEEEEVPEAPVADDTADAGANTDAEADGDAAIDGETEEPAAPDREQSEADGTSLYEQAVKNLDDQLYKFTLTPGGASIFAIQQSVTANYFKISNGNNYIAKEAKNELVMYGDEEESVEDDTDEEVILPQDEVIAE